MPHSCMGEDSSTNDSIFDRIQKGAVPELHSPVTCPSPSSYLIISILSLQFWFMTLRTRFGSYPPLTSVLLVYRQLSLSSLSLDAEVHFNLYTSNFKALEHFVLSYFQRSTIFLFLKAESTNWTVLECFLRASLYSI